MRMALLPSGALATKYATNSVGVGLARPARHCISRTNRNSSQKKRDLQWVNSPSANP
jgi:hypothetical protein